MFNTQMQEHQSYYMQYGNNFGDLLTPYIYRKINHQNFIDINLNLPYFIFGGSLIRDFIINPSAVILGAGILKKEEYICHPLDVISVRGKYTRNRLLELGINCPECYGDTSFVLPHLYKPKNTEKIYNLGIIPHQIDFNDINDKLKTYIDHENIFIINLNVSEDNTIENIIDKINFCEKTISSSLHGIIISHLYNIPSIWCKFKNNLEGDNIKFYDYFSSVDINNDIVDYSDIIQNINGIESYNNFIENVNNEFDIKEQPQFPIESDNILELYKKTFQNPKYGIHVENKIPNIIHYFFLKPLEFNIIHLISILSAYFIQKPDNIYVYVDEEPENNLLWELAKNYIIVEKIKPKRNFRGIKIDHVQYLCDILRLEILIEKGGIYLDIDNIVLKNFNHLLDNYCVMGGDPEGNIQSLNNKEINVMSNSIILSVKNNPFLIYWYDTLHEKIYNKDLPWAWHAVCYPAEILKDHKKFKDYITLVEWHKTFKGFADNPEIMENKNIVDEMEEALIIAFYQTLPHQQFLKNIRFDYFKNHNNTFTILFDKYYRIIKEKKQDIYNMIYNSYLYKNYKLMINAGLHYIDLFEDDNSEEYQYVLFFIAAGYLHLQNKFESLKYHYLLRDRENLDFNIKSWINYNVKLLFR